MNQTYKATLSQYALPQFLPIYSWGCLNFTLRYSCFPLRSKWGGKGGVIWGDLEGWSRDPMFEKYPSISPYTYCKNNPVMFVDPTGMEIEGVTYDKKTKTFIYTEDAIARGTQDYIEARRSTSHGQRDIMKMINSKKTFSLNVTNKAMFIGNAEKGYVQVSGYQPEGTTSLYVSTYDYDHKGEAPTDFSQVMVVNSDGSSTIKDISNSKKSRPTVTTASTDMSNAYKESGLEAFEQIKANEYKSRQQAIHGIGAHEETHLFQSPQITGYVAERNAYIHEMYERKQYIIKYLKK
ncbi:MAG: hypothetical protein PHI52_00875 [Bacteroidales bacterium]|nr:hypothetical protein [Bacteroidales bacterium]